MSDFEIRPAEVADDDEVLALLQTSLTWLPDGTYRRFLDWKHRENPFGTSPAWVAVDADGRILGYRTWLRWRFVSPDGEVHRAVRAVDTATHPDARGRGIFKALTLHAVDAARDEGVSFVFNTPNSQSAPGYLKMGWQEVGSLRVGVRPTSVLGLARTARARVAAEMLSLPTEVGRPAPEVLSSEGLDPLIDGLTRGNAWRTYLDAEVLRWRYRLPELHYRALGLSAEPAAGVIVFRLRRRGPSHEAVVCQVLAPNDRAERSLLRLLARSVPADHLLRLRRSVEPLGLSLPVPGLGPLLTWRELSVSAMPPLDAWDLSMGDIELF